MVKSFFEKGKYQMNSNNEFKSMQNHNLKQRSQVSIKGEEQETAFRKLCSKSKMDSALKIDRQCKYILTNSWRQMKSIF